MYEMLYQKVKGAICHITAYLDDEKISEGSGFAFNHLGQVITACHVSAGKFPIGDKEFYEPAWKIFCKFPGHPIIEYGQTFSVLAIDVPGFSKKVYLDVAILVPKVSDTLTLPFIPIAHDAVAIGQEVFIAGFSDEVVLPFEFGRYLRPETPGAREFHEAMGKGFAADMGNLMIKRGVIGNHRVCVASSANDHDLACSVFYVDNGMHSGASGGPVVNVEGEAIGLITQRAMTDAAQSSHPEPLLIPSGSTLCLGLESVKWLSVKSHGTKS